jgi:hypothetical protein
MPNWCENEIDIEGTREQIDRIIADIGDSNEWMQALIPLEGEEWERINEEKDYLLSPLSPFYGSKWYATRDDCSMFDTGYGYIIISVDSAWSPFVPFCQKVSKKYGVEVRIRFFESGCDFGGEEIFKNGEQTHHFHAGYNEALYVLDRERFWYDIEHYLDSLKEEEHTWEDVVKDYPFLEPYDLERLKSEYENNT